MIPRTVTSIIALSLLLAASAIQAECAPSLIGSPCAQGGIANASQMEPAITLAVGNPIHLATGNKYQQDTDLPANPTVPGLELIRHYNAMDARPSALGQGWALSYDSRLHRAPAGWQIVQADGTRISFPDHHSDARAVHQNRHGRLDHVNGQHIWTWPSGTAIRFDQNGDLIALQWPNGQGVYIQRHNDNERLKGAIQTVHNDQGQFLHFHYNPLGKTAQLTAVDTPLGRFSYGYDAENRLIQVRRPDTLQRRYLYEPALQNGHPHALTGIELVSAASQTSQEAQRTHTWRYDLQGRAIESIRGGPDDTRHKLQIDYQRTPSAQQDGLTVVTNENQQATTFQTGIRGGRHVLLSVQGAGCFGCAAAGTHADYDNDGRLTSVNGTQIKRTPAGSIDTLQPAQSGWPELSIHYNTAGQRTHWHSTPTGTEHMHYSAHGLPLERLFSNGDAVIMRYDAQHRPVVVHEQHGDARATTRLQWHGHRLVRIDHPAETELRQYDALGRVINRNITRNPTGSGQRLEFTEQFRYDDQHRITHHQLPEGGSLHYHWGQGPQLKAIYWQDITGHKHTIIDTQPDQPGYRYGNGLHLHTRAGSDHLIDQLQLRYQDHLIWAQTLNYDTRQRIASEHFYANVENSAPHTSGWRYAYDAHSRLNGYHPIPDDPNTTNVIATTDNPVTTWQAWHADGSAAAVRKHDQTVRPDIHRDASGLALHADGFDVSYGASRRLETVQKNGQIVARYQHNAFGYRIRRSNPHGKHRDYLYLNNRLVAEATWHDNIKTNSPSHSIANTNANANANAGTSASASASAEADATHASTPRVTRRYIYAHHVPVAVIDYSDLASGQYYAIHADLQGAPRLVTDQQRRVRWYARYSPLGQATNITGDIPMDLRLPGQVADPDTGWHDNLLRTYQPQWGHYLEPDPLGPIPGNQAYGYASQQPRRYMDPMGLLLFAFDGTRQSADTQGNVWKFSQYYLDGPVHYHPGPGNSVFINWDAVTAHQASQIIETQWKWLLHELSRPQAATDIIPIDILGFSRGAALARHFGNMIAQHVHQGLFRFHDPIYGSVSACVDLRFMGLFDTVAQFGIAGSQNQNYDLGIAAAWEWVAHAVALHERRWLFPLTAASGNLDHNVVEAPFIGAHSDIGGGILPPHEGAPASQGDLSNVALNWMIWQARAASVPLDGLSDEDGTISQPIVHDFRSAAMRAIQDGDRRVDATNGQRWLDYQDNHPRLGRRLRTQTERLIQRPDNGNNQAGPDAGTVDMDGYAQWLYNELGWHAIPV